MIWRLTYCNKKGVEARIDIIKGNRTPVEIVQGSGQPFTLAYKLDKNDKSGHIMTSSADIEIFETETFNIDDLKTSNETELKVEYFEENILTWSGFILPDFFSREIGSPNIVRMTASDRLTALKGVTLSDLPLKVSLRSLIERCLTKTGLNLGLVSQIQINQGSTNILDSEILSQRLTDVRGRSISCYDILMSIMVGTNSTIRQRAGQWQVYNKLEHELRTPTISFDKVERGAIRTIQPVASSVGIYQEYGGGRSYPKNYDFSDGLTGWTKVNGFVGTVDNRQVDKYSLSGFVFTPIYGNTTDKYYLKSSRNDAFSDENSPYIRSSLIDVVYPDNESVNIAVTINASTAGSYIFNSFVEFAVIARKGVDEYSLDASGLFNDIKDNKPHIHRIKYPLARPDFSPITLNKKVEGVLTSNDVDLSGYTVEIRIYGSGPNQMPLIHSSVIDFSLGYDLPKGNLYKTTQGSNFTKQHDIETTIFGDYITNGLNGYFYNYPIDDTSNLYLPSGTLSPPTWITAFDTTERPLLHHVSRQKSSLFSVAHDILKANINVESFDPLAIFQDCKGGKYVVVSANFDFLRSEVDVELEQIAYDNTILKRDFIYSYFGEGEDSIKSIGGIAGGGGGTGGGGGMTSEQLEMLTNLADWWKLDEENDAIYSEKSVYSLKGVSALGLGSGGGGGGGDFDRLDAWVDYNETKANWVLSALLGYDLHTRVNSLEASGGGSDINIAITGSGNAVTGVSLSGNTLTFAKGSTFALASHTHTIAQITGLQGALNSKATQSDIDTAIDGIEIGGRNLVENSKIPSSPNTVFTDSVKGQVRLVTADPAYWADRITTPFLAGETVSFSISCRRVSGSGIISMYLNPNNNYVSLGTVGTEWVTLRLTRTINVGVTLSDILHINGISTAGLLIEWIKLEKGTKATDWTPAPEDQVSDWNITDVASLSYIKNKPTTLAGYGITDGVTLNTAQTITGVKTFTGNVTAPTFVGALSGNASSATKLNTARTIWGQSFNGTGNVSGALTNVSGITGTTTVLGINPMGEVGGIVMDGSTNSIRPYTSQAGIENLGIANVRWGTLYAVNGNFTGNVTASAGVNTPKVDFGNGFTIEPSGTELVFKYNGVIKQRMLSTGTILATGGITALST